MSHVDAAAPRLPAYLVRRDGRSRAVLIVAALMSLAYGIQALIDLARPEIDGQHQRAIGLLDPNLPNGIEVTFWCYLLSLGLAVFVGLVGRAQVNAATDPAQWERRLRSTYLLAAAVLVTPFAMYPLSLLGGHLDYAMVCVPSTAFALWVVHHLQRYRRIPVRMLLAAFGWGALFGTGFGGSMNLWLADYYGNYAKPSSSFDAFRGLIRWLTVSAGTFEELGKGAGVAILYLLYRRYFDNVVSGIVVGAAVGLGFNLVETVEYLAAGDGLVSAQQYWARQSLGLFTAHLAFTAVIGAAFGVARQSRSPGEARRVIACGFVLAMACHFANDALIEFYGHVKENWFSPSTSMDVFLLEPALFVVLDGALVVLYLLLVRAGLKQQHAGLAVELPAEARTGSGAVTDDEIGVLLRPEQRFYLKMQALFRDGLIGYRALGRLFAAQLDLGMQRWHRARDEVDEFAPDEPLLRERVRQRRAEWDQLRRPEAVSAT